MLKLPETRSNFHKRARYTHRITKREQAAVDVLYSPLKQSGGVLPKQLAQPRLIEEFRRQPSAQRITADLPKTKQ